MDIKNIHRLVVLICMLLFMMPCISAKADRDSVGRDTAGRDTVGKDTAGRDTMKYVRQSAVAVEGVRVHASEDSVTVTMMINLSSLNLASKRALYLNPFIQVDGDSIPLPQVGIMGRRQYHYYQRNFVDGNTVDSLLVRRKNNTRQVISYTYSVPVDRKPNFVKVYIDKDSCGCNGKVLMDSRMLIDERNFSDFIPRLAYIQPEVEMRKTREEKGRALIDFPVNEVSLYPTYRNNAQEIEGIEKTIELIINDPDVILTGVRFRGYASPEGSYSNNSRLAFSRTQTLVDYVKGLYDIPSKMLTFSYEPENWDGLRAFVDSSALVDRDTILAIIDSNMEPDVKERTLRTEHGESFRKMLRDYFPALRYTEYVIEYTVRGFDVKEAQRIVWERPQKLSLNEMYAVANTYATGSNEFREVFEIAVRLFPEAETANLNAANAALLRKDTDAAKKYLSKAGDSPEADLARGVYAYYMGDMRVAEWFFRQALQNGLEEAEYNLSELERIKKNQ